MIVTQGLRHGGVGEVVNRRSVGREGKARQAGNEDQSGMNTKKTTAEYSSSLLAYEQNCISHSV